MLVLDEQLLGRGIEAQLKHWYGGSVVFITDLRPGTVIKDDAIPLLLRQQRQPTFVTINVQDSWQRVTIDRRFCVVRFPLPDSRIVEIPDRLRAAFRLPRFRTTKGRMGTVLRVTHAGVNYYTFADRDVKAEPFLVSG